MSTSVDIQKQLLSPPGDTIQETIDHIGMSQVELAERLGRPKEKVNDIIKGRDSISTDTAFRLQRVLGIPASFWMNREKEYRREIYEIEQQEILAERHDWLQSFPLAKMRSLGWIQKFKDKSEAVAHLLSWFSMASTSEWQNIYIAEEVTVAFRISLAHTNDPYAISAWLRKGELESKGLTLAPYDKNLFKQVITNLKELVVDHPDDLAQQLQVLCAEAGVAVVYVPNLPKAPISGASRWYRGQPLIQLSGRYKSGHHFWFTFFHEAAHVLKHPKKEVFLKDVEGTPIDAQKEKEADEFAAQLLLTKKQEAEILRTVDLTDESILTFAERFSTSPGVIVGRLQHLKRWPYTKGNHLKRKVNLF